MAVDEKRDSVDAWFERGNRSQERDGQARAIYDWKM